MKRPISEPDELHNYNSLHHFIHCNIITSPRYHQKPEHTTITSPSLSTYSMYVEETLSLCRQGKESTSHPHHQIYSYVRPPSPRVKKQRSEAHIFVSFDIMGKWQFTVRRYGHETLHPIHGLLLYSDVSSRYFKSPGLPQHTPAGVVVVSQCVFSYLSLCVSTHFTPIYSYLLRDMAPVGTPHTSSLTANLYYYTRTPHIYVLPSKIHHRFKCTTGRGKPVGHSSTTLDTR